MSDHRKYEHYARKIKLFNGLKPEEVSEILHMGDKIHFHAGQTIFHKGQLGANIFIVLNGTVAIENDGVVIGKCRAGDAFGEMSVLNHNPHCASAAASSDVTLFTLDENQLTTILQKNASVRLLLNIIHVLSGHLERANTFIAKRLNEDAAAARK